MKFSKGKFLKKKNELFLALSILVSACANVVSPTGGPKDETAPKLVSENPKNKTLNFAEKKIEIEFNEMVQLKNQYKEISITPEMELAPEITAKKNTVIIKFVDTLSKNTTYSINFGNSIADINESNEYKNYHYVFSTGKFIDSLKISGTVDYIIDTAQTKEVLVALYPTDIEKLYKQKPIIYTSTTTGGKYELNNIKNGKYAIYAYKDLNGNKRFDDDELLGFLNNNVDLQKDSSKINFTLAKQVPKNLRVSYSKYYEGRVLVKLNYPDDSVNFNVFYPNEFKNKLLIDKASSDSISLWLPTTKFDSTQIQLTKNGKPFDTLMVRNFIKDPKLGLFKITDNVSSGILKPNDTLKLTTSRPLKLADVTKLELLEDSVKIKTGFTITPSKKKIREYIVTYEWDSTKKYDINIKERQFTDIYDAFNAQYKRTFIQDTSANYGIVSAKFTIPKDKQYIVQLLNTNQEIVGQLIANENKVYKFINLTPERYKMRFIEDANKNKKWDIGNVYHKIQPEKISYYPDEIAVRAGWDMEVNVNLE
ncbi:Ig-like domain-containing protein [Solitalea lacus]|uniref:Ig-like domain-containing protein n=1 Tax=Solitalea lacus TaxID=2911172 RepID=UPI001EDBB9F1|nr:Ig-like domain-containing protein [Solitalea lacus]UKJ07810.1 Ig-like domain-containing protein [Solitalea lacus]